MRLAELAYEVAKDSIEFPGAINFIGFVRGDYDEDRDYSQQISSAFNYINLAFSRLITDKKTLLFVDKETSDDGGYIDMGGDKVTAVIDMPNPNYSNLRFMEYGNGIAIEKPGAEVYVEHRKTIPHFALDSIRKDGLDDDGKATTVENEIELKDYGITDEMCSYVKEYAKGGMTEYISPSISQTHINMAESYFAKLKTMHTNYPQSHVYQEEW